MHRTAKTAVVLAMIALGLVLVLDVLYFANGSLEMFPTEADHRTVRTATGMLAVLLVTALAGLGWIFRLLIRRPGRSAPESAWTR
ncbi:hypothetical protein [Longimicrobium terrae]|uniref:Uncharacterized protein n=1 Tax=Longimicrobium terrae TaxID=1639882 RepID=A0A841H0K5_9BACT|nr:hypothetical protein [Longimicrobium terrae]MBB4637196.1 hypothetical protein [Longimicrobium terrae]MBB6071543.1 hypothetical protein [Longimicrobium terrae]NNC30038.1 hypothetical protein [Longimicrobium terrae]